MIHELTSASEPATDPDARRAGSAERFRGKFRFGSFEVDFSRRELRRRGLRLKLQNKPFQVLEVLLASPGVIVTRSRLAEHLWPGLHVNFDHSLNTAVNCLRQVLNDSSRTPRFVETLPGVGYRFVAHVEVIGEENGAERVRRPIPVTEAYYDYLKGRYFSNKLVEDDLRKSAAHFESAIAQDPRCSVAYAGMADVYMLFAKLGTLPPAEAGRHAMKYITSAIELDPNRAEAHASLAGARAIFHWDWPGAEREYLRALDIDRNCAEARRSYSELLTALGRPQDALEQLRRAQEVDAASSLINIGVAWTAYMARDYTSAANEAWKTLALEPRFPAAQHILGLAYEQLEMLDEAMVEFINARVCSGHHPMMIAALGHAWALAGKVDEASKILHELDEISMRRYVPAYWISLIHAALGAFDTAFEWLNKAVQARDVWLIWAKVDPRLDSMRREPRFENLLRRIF